MNMEGSSTELLDNFDKVNQLLLEDPNLLSDFIDSIPLTDQLEAYMVDNSDLTQFKSMIEPTLALEYDLPPFTILSPAFMDGGTFDRNRLANIFNNTSSVPTLAAGVDLRFLSVPPLFVTKKTKSGVRSVPFDYKKTIFQELVKWNKQRFPPSKEPKSRKRKMVEQPDVPRDLRPRPEVDRTEEARLDKELSEALERVDPKPKKPRTSTSVSITDKVPRIEWMSTVFPSLPWAIMDHDKLKQRLLTVDLELGSEPVTTGRLPSFMRSLFDPVVDASFLELDKFNAPKEDVNFYAGTEYHQKYKHVSPYMWTKGYRFQFQVQRQVSGVGLTPYAIVQEPRLGALLSVAHYLDPRRLLYSGSMYAWVKWILDDENNFKSWFFEDDVQKLWKNITTFGYDHTEMSPVTAKMIEDAEEEASTHFLNHMLE